MSRSVLIAIFGAALCTVVGWRAVHSVSDVQVQNSRPFIPQAMPACPWRDAESDLSIWFPGATEYRIEDTILSGKWIELQHRLGRALFPEENVLHAYIVRNHDALLGTVLTRRVKSENGAIEIAVGLNTEDRIDHFKIQRLREPEEIVRGLESLNLSAQLRNKSVQDLDGIVAGVTSSVAASPAREIMNGVRSVLILHEAGGKNSRGAGR